MTQLTPFLFSEVGSGGDVFELRVRNEDHESVSVPMRKNIEFPWQIIILQPSKSKEFALNGICHISTMCRGYPSLHGQNLPDFSLQFNCNNTPRSRSKVSIQTFAAPTRGGSTEGPSSSSWVDDWGDGAEEKRRQTITTERRTAGSGTGRGAASPGGTSRGRGRGGAGRSGDGFGGRGRKPDWDSGARANTAEDRRPALEGGDRLSGPSPGIRDPSPVRKAPYREGLFAKSSPSETSTPPPRSFATLTQSPQEMPAPLTSSAVPEGEAPPAAPPARPAAPIKPQPLPVVRERDSDKGTFFHKSTSFKGIGASPEVIAALSALGITRPSHVQAEAYQLLLDSRCGCKMILRCLTSLVLLSISLFICFYNVKGPSLRLVFTLFLFISTGLLLSLNRLQHVAIMDQAGSGKTLAYLLPILQLLRQEERKAEAAADSDVPVEADKAGRPRGLAQPGSPRFIVAAPTIGVGEGILILFHALGQVT